MPNLFKMKNGRSPYWHCWYRHHITGRQRYFSCKTINEEEAICYAEMRLQQIQGISSRGASTQAHRTRTASEAGSAYTSWPMRLVEFTDLYVTTKRTKRKNRPYTEKSRKALRDTMNQFRKRVGDRYLHEITL